MMTRDCVLFSGTEVTSGTSSTFHIQQSSKIFILLFIRLQIFALHLFFKNANSTNVNKIFQHGEHTGLKTGEAHRKVKQKSATNETKTNTLNFTC